MIKMENKQEIEKEYSELFKTIGLNSNEIKALISIYSSKSVSPIEIAEITDIPKSKIYGVFKSLKERGFLRQIGKTYEIQPEILEKEKQQFEKTFERFTKFLERLIESFPVVEDLVVKKIVSLFEELGYGIEYNKKFDFSSDTHFPPHYIRLFREITPPWFIIGVSSTSGRKVGVLIMQPNIAREFKKFDGFYFLRDYLDRYKIDMTVIIGNESIKDLERYKNMITISLLTDYREHLKEKLETFDRKWQQIRETLDRLEEDVEKPHGLISQLTASLGTLRAILKQDISFGKKQIIQPWLYKSLEEVIDRLGVDLKTDTDIYLNLKFKLKELQSKHKQTKILPLEEEITSIRSEANNIYGDLETLKKETGKLLEEILDILKGTEYKKQGYTSNPFVFTIPIEEHLEIVGQERAVNELRNFVEDVQSDTGKNVLFIIDEPGMGKTHIMKFFVEQMNKETIENSLGLYIRCKSGTDLIQIFGQIQIEISKLPNSSLKDILLSVLNEVNAPMTINDLIDVLRNISKYCYEKSKKKFFLFIDEFENLISSTAETNTSLLQLKNLIQTRQVGFIIVLRVEYWKKISGIRQFIQENNYKTIHMERFDEILTELLLNKRLMMFSESKAAQIKFDKTFIHAVIEKSKGNVREIVTISRDAFRKAIQNKINIISRGLIADSKQTTLNKN